ncbi:DUF2179 domain-containing protein [Bacillus testis]|uniref:DUF2179 domain-containing protein n=1 Tax=Bacillus testis TaxID=1622072 RepID=UPI00067F3DA8|nr:DUF2179 domain-containing protein [Bacillus testis]
MKDIILILILQLIYVPCFTLRTIFLVKQLRVPAALLGFVEALIYVFGLSIVFNGDQSFLGMLVYAIGFGLGILIGTAIEQKLAIGYTTFNVNLPTRNQDLIDHLRVEGYGVTIISVEGFESKRYKLEILTKRNMEDSLIELIREYEPHAFIISYEPRRFIGGYMVSNMKKRKKKFDEKQK